MITVLLVDDHAYIRRGIRSLLETTGDIEVVATAANGIDAIMKARSLRPDIVIIDISMPFIDGVEATKQIRMDCPDARILTLSLYDNPEYVRQSLEAGAQGYVLKEKAASELPDAIRSLYNGNHYFSEKIARMVKPHSSEGDDDSWAA
ncbi:MAG TPA: response regulator transcription factor [Anaerolineales bacterium]|nr:response regulator transcription factor [Anaerolineales bacterium]